MKEVVATSCNPLAFQHESRVEAMVELVLVVHEPTYHVEDGKIIRTLSYSEERVYVTPGALRGICEALLEYAGLAELLGERIADGGLVLPLDGENAQPAYCFHRGHRIDVVSMSDGSVCAATMLGGVRWSSDRYAASEGQSAVDSARLEIDAYENNKAQSGTSPIASPRA